MSGSELNFVMYSIILLSLFIIDYALGNGLVEIVQKWFCNIVCFVRNAVREEDKYFAQVPGADDKINLLVVLGEVAVLSVTMIVSFSFKAIKILIFLSFYYVGIIEFHCRGSCVI